MLPSQIIARTFWELQSLICDFCDKEEECSNTDDFNFCPFLRTKISSIVCYKNLLDFEKSNHFDIPCSFEEVHYE